MGLKTVSMFNMVISFCMLELLPSSSHPIANTNNTVILSSVIDKAVNYSLMSFNTPKNLSIILVSKIMEIMQSKGVQLSYAKKKCKPLEATKLEELFYRQTGLNCVSLTKLNLPTEHNERETYIVTTNSSCLTRVRKDSVCFPSRRKAYCGTSTSVTYLDDLSDNYFPRLVSELKCSGCRWERGHTCNTCGFIEHQKTIKLLKRVPEECEEDGSEKWIIDSKTVTVGIGCSCIRV